MIPGSPFKKTEKSLRNKTYKLKPSEIILTSACFDKELTTQHDDEDPEPFHGFTEIDIPKTDNKFTDVISNLQDSIPKPEDAQ